MLHTNVQLFKLERDALPAGSFSVLWKRLVGGRAGCPGRLVQKSAAESVIKITAAAHPQMGSCSLVKARRGVKDMQYHTALLTDCKAHKSR